MGDLSGRLGLPCDGLGATRPPQTLRDPGAVKPDTCPCPCTPAYTTMLMHDPDRGRWGPTQSSQRSICAHPHAVAATAGPTMCHGVRHTGGGAQSADMMHEVGAEPLDHRIRSAGLETGEACGHSAKYGCGGQRPLQALHLPLLYEMES